MKYSATAFSGEWTMDDHDLEDLLSDRIVILLQSRDGISPEDVREALRTAQANTRQGRESVRAASGRGASADPENAPGSGITAADLRAVAADIRGARSVEDLRTAIDRNLCIWSGLSASVFADSLSATIKQAVRYVTEHTRGAGRAAPEDLIIEQFIMINENVAMLIDRDTR